MKDFLNELSAPEQKAFEQLKELQIDSVWGLAIKNVCEKPGVMRFRRLICELKSQAHDCEEVMKSILGHAYEAVMLL